MRVLADLERRAANGLTRFIASLTSSEWWRRVPMYVVVLLALLIIVRVISDRAKEFTGPDIATMFLSVLTLALLVLVQTDTMNEQLRLRHLQTRPQVLVYFEVRPSSTGQDRRDIFVVVEHFAGGPALDVDFRFSPALVNDEGQNFSEDPPFSTGIAITQPRSSIPIRFADFGSYQDQAGATRLFTNNPMPIRFTTTVRLRGPLADGKTYTTRYDLDLEHLLDYQMDIRTTDAQS